MRYMPTAPRLPLPVTLTGVCDGVDLASPSIKRNLNICQGTIDDAVGLFQKITDATSTYNRASDVCMYVCMYHMC